MKTRVIKIVVASIGIVLLLVGCSKNSTSKKTGENGQVVSSKVSKLKIAKEDNGDAQIFGIWMGEKTEPNGEAAKEIKEAQKPVIKNVGGTKKAGTKKIGYFSIPKSSKVTQNEDGTVLNVTGKSEHFKLIAQFVNKSKVDLDFEGNSMDPDVINNAKKKTNDKVRPLAQQIITGYNSDFSNVMSYPFGKDFKVNDLEVQLASYALSDVPKLNKKKPDGSVVIVIPKGDDYIAFLLIGDNADHNDSTWDADMYYLLAGSYTN